MFEVEAVEAELEGNAKPPKPVVVPKAGSRASTLVRTTLDDGTMAALTFCDVDDDDDDDLMTIACV